MFQIKFQYVYLANVFTIIAFGVFEVTHCRLFLFSVVFVFKGDDSAFVVWLQ